MKIIELLFGLLWRAEICQKNFYNKQKLRARQISASFQGDSSVW